MNRVIHAVRALVLGAILALAAGPLQAHERVFAFTDTAEILPKGAFEYEQWVSNRFGRAEGVYSRWDLRSEFETSFTERLGAALYLNLKNVYQSVQDQDPLSPTFGSDISTEETGFEGVSFELKYLLMNPNEKPFGLLLYLEPTFGNGELETEVKLILSTGWSEKWQAALNLIAEPEWIYQASSQGSELTLIGSAALGYALSPSCWLGGEARYRSVITDFNDSKAGAEHGGLYAGPSVHASYEKFWLSFSILAQVNGWPETFKGEPRQLDDEEKVHSRFVLGVNF